MKDRKYSLPSLLFCLVVFAAGLAAVNTSYLHRVSLGSEFLWLSLASIVVLHLRIHPGLKEFFLILLLTAFYSGWAFAIRGFHPHYMAVLSYLGVSSLVIMAMRVFGSRERERSLLLWALAAGLLFVGSNWVAPQVLALAERTHPKTLDLFLLSFDGTLHVQFSFLLGMFLSAHPYLRVVSYLCYFGLSIPLAFVYSERLQRQAGHLETMCAFLFCTILGPLFYNLFPALGPKYVFQDNFPFHPLPVESLPRLFLEPIPIHGLPNAMPSLHMAWVLLAVWYSRGLSLLTRTLTFLFFAFTVLATLGTGEHYFVDLVVAFPFCLFVAALFPIGLFAAWNVRAIRWKLPLVGLTGLLCWIFLLRFGVPALWKLPTLSWVLVLVTIAGVWRLSIDLGWKRHDAAPSPVSLSNSSTPGSPSFEPEPSPQVPNH